MLGIEQTSEKCSTTRKVGFKLTTPWAEAGDIKIERLFAYILRSGFYMALQFNFYELEAKATFDSRQ